jgi:hypothetical protein
MRAVDWFIRGLTSLAALGFLFLPAAIAWTLMCASFFAVGLWSVLFPPGILGWAKMTRRDLDPSDRSIWWVPKFIGVSFIIFSVVLAVAYFK